MSEIGICLTGHRPDKLYGYEFYNDYIIKYKTDNPYFKIEEVLYKEVERIVDKFDLINLSCGLALGADTCWARAILRLKEKYPNKIKFYAHIPNWDHCRVWKHKPSRDFWQYLINNADNIVCLDPIGNINPAISLNMRNGTMVDMSEVVFAISNGDTIGGTANCLKLARKKNRKIKIWNPLNLD